MPLEMPAEKATSDMLQDTFQPMAKVVNLIKASKFLVFKVYRFVRCTASHSDCHDKP